MNSKSWMELETAESAEIILNQHNNSLGIIEEITKRLQNAPPNYVGTLARGSSDHAANFAKYAIETQIGIITSSIAPSIHSIYKTNLNYKNSLVIAISQSGKSSDVIESLIFARKQGAITLAFVNEEQSPLAQEAEYCVPLIANKERSVAATKSFIASLSRLIQFISFWKDHTELNKQLLSIPSHLLDTKNDQINIAVQNLIHKKSILIIGRGYTFPIALESALKLKETCGIHAEAFSGAEILHGPIELIQKNYPILIYLAKDETLVGMLKLIETLKTKNAKIFVITTNEVAAQFNNELLNTTVISTQNSFSPLCDTILFISQFYNLAAKLSKKLGRNPDSPANLNKVTITV